MTTDSVFILFKKTVCLFFVHKDLNNIFFDNVWECTFVFLYSYLLHSRIFMCINFSFLLNCFIIC